MNNDVWNKCDNGILRFFMGFGPEERSVGCIRRGVQVTCKGAGILKPFIKLEIYKINESVFIRQQWIIISFLDVFPPERLLPELADHNWLHISFDKDKFHLSHHSH